MIDNMSKHGRHRRQKDRVGMMIVALSTVCMVLILVVFFAVAMEKAPDPAPKDPVNSDTQKVPTDMVNDGTDADPMSSEKNTQTPTPSDTEDTENTEDTTEPLTAQITENIDTTTPPTVDVHYNEELLKQVVPAEAQTPEGYVDSLVFYGDSTTHGMKAYKVFGSRDTKQVWTPTSGTLALFRASTDLIYDPNTQTEKSLSDLCASVKPKYLIMTLGVNGVSSMGEDWFKADYQNLINIIRKASPDTKLILQSIFPVARSYANQTAINNTKICQANEWIVELAAQNGLPYLNTYSVLVGADGYLPETYQNGDGMHFNEIGFAAVMDYVKTHPCT